MEPELSGAGTSEKEEQLQLYRDAMHWLKLAADESCKPGDVDLAQLLVTHECASTIVQRLMRLEEHPVRLSGLEQLGGVLTMHQKVLQDKRRQLEGETPETGRVQGSLLDQRRRWVVEDMLVVAGGLQLSSVVGLQEAKQLLREAVLLPLTFPHLFSGNRQPWRRILLYGPPGTGKTRLAYAIAGESKASFYSVSSANILSSWVGESEKLIRDLFRHARQQSARPVIIFVDEVDSVCRQRSMKEEDHSRRVKTELLRQMEAVGEDNIFLLCATNCPWELDPAFLRRFQRKIFINLPCREARCELLKLHLGSTGVSLSSEDLQMVADNTQGYTGCDIAHLASEALLRPVRELDGARHWMPVGGQLLQPCSPSLPGAMMKSLCDLLPEQVYTRNVVADDVFAAMETCGPSVSEEDLAQFVVFSGRHGRPG